jgi:hypothetical protein
MKAIIHRELAVLRDHELACLFNASIRLLGLPTGHLLQHPTSSPTSHPSPCLGFLALSNVSEQRFGVDANSQM